MKIVLRAFIFVGGLGAVAACGGAPEVREQNHGRLTPPEYPQGAGPFALTETQSVGNFEGSLILWSSTVNAPQIQAISDASVNGRRTKAAALVAIEEGLLSALKAQDDARQRLDEINAKIARTEAERFASPEFKAQTKPVAEQWFDGRLTTLLSSRVISEADKTHALVMFGAYCEAKLWELATGPLAHASFNERPTPNQMCEPYYASRGYFDDESRCGVANRRVYFDCLWQDGVLKSALMAEEIATKTCPGTDVYPNRKAAIEAWVASGLLKSVLSDQSPFETTTYADKMAAYVMAANENISSTGLPAKPAYADLKRCRAAFRRSDLGLPIERWDAASPYALRDVAEVALIDVSAMPYKLLPGTGDADTDKRRYEMLAHFVNVFGQRARVDSSETAASYSDYLFNHKADGTTLEKNGKANECAIVGRAGSLSCRNEADPAFARFAELKRSVIPAADQQEQAKLSLAVAKNESAVAEAKQNQDRLLGKVKESALAGAAAVNAPNATVYFNSFAVQLVRNREAKDGVVVSFRIKGAERGFVGCIPTGVEVGCSVPTEWKAKADAFESLSFDSARGRLTIRGRLQLAEVYGFAANSRAGTTELRQSFNDLDSASYAGTLLEVDMYANSLDGVLDFFTGNAKIIAGEQDIYNGSVSGDNFSEAMARLSQQAGL